VSPTRFRNLLGTGLPLAVVVSLAALAALAAGCAHQSVAPRPPGQVAPPAADLLAALARRHQALRTLELETRTTSWLGGERARATVLMLVDRAGRLRFEVEVPVQGTVAALAVNGSNFSHVDYEHRVFQQGPACPANVARLIPIPLLPEEVAAILLGDAPLGEGAAAQEVSWDGERKADVLVVERKTAGAGATRLWVSMRPAPPPLGYDVLAVEGETPGTRATGQRWRVAYDDLTRKDGIGLPGAIRFAEPGKSFDDGVEIKVKERMGVNRPLRDEVFTLAAPAGFAATTLRCR
jgi:hypothetical protein